MPKLLIEGKVVGFVLVSLPGTAEEKTFRLGSVLEVAMKTRELGIHELPISEKPRCTISTIFKPVPSCLQPDAGEEEEVQEGYDGFRLAEVGAMAFKTFCTGYTDPCDNSVGWSAIRGSNYGRSSNLCSSCRRQRAEDDGVDVDVVYDRLELEEEH